MDKPGTSNEATDSGKPKDEHESAAPRRHTDKPAACYASMLAGLRAVARQHGYALTLHGSMQRDLDLVAVPWVEEASDAATLVEAVRVWCGGHIVNDPNADPNDYTRRNPQQNPHGRLGWSIHLGGGPYIDLSVMPRLSA